MFYTARTKRPILISPGYGAGWSTWAHDPEAATAALTYQPLIDAVLRGDKIGEDHPAVVSFLESLGPDAYFYCGGLRDITVAYVEGDFDVNEYDGSESVTCHGGSNRTEV